MKSPISNLKSSGPRKLGRGFALPGELTLKAWQHQQAALEQRSYRAVQKRFARGKYPHLQLRRVNPRVIFVIPQPA